MLKYFPLSQIDIPCELLVIHRLIPLKAVNTVSGSIKTML